MAKPRVFISSTYYDLKQTREDIASFLINLGYEPVRNEEGNIPYGKDEKLTEYCYKEIRNVDILVAIIGGRFGSLSEKDSPWSVSNEELRTALKNEKQVYIFIEKNVESEYGTYLENKDREIKYRYVDDVRIYQFIEEIKSLSNNNNIKAFETSSEIQHYLKEQLSGLFQSFLSSQSRAREYSLAAKLDSSIKSLERLVDSMVENEKNKAEGATNLMKMTHPIVKRLSELLGVKFGFWLSDFETLDSFLRCQGWRLEGSESSSESLIRWVNFDQALSIDPCIFTDDHILKDIKYADWNDDWVLIEESATDINLLDEDVPF